MYMRRFLTFLFFGAAISSAWGQAPEYYPLKPGTKKYFQVVINQTTVVAGQTMTLTVYSRNEEEVAGPSKVNDKPAVLVRTSRRDSVSGRPMEDAKLAYRVESFYQTRPQGVFLLANFNLPSDSTQKPDSARYEPPLQVLKLPADSGAAWSVGTMRMQGIAVGLNAQVVGRENVETPAGAFKNCLKTKSNSTSVSGALQSSQRLSMTVSGGDFTSTSWYAPGVGLVKQEVSSRFVMTSPNLPPGMSAELNFRQNLVLTKTEPAPKEEKKEVKKK